MGQGEASQGLVRVPPGVEPHGGDDDEHDVSRRVPAQLQQPGTSGLELICLPPDPEHYQFIISTILYFQ